MDLGIALISGLLGAGGLIGFVQFMISRHDKRDEQLGRIEKKIDKLDSKSDRNELAITRLQLLFLIQSQPGNKEAIQQTAQRYFLELDGNGEAWDAFREWAEKSKVDAGYYKALLQREKERRYK